MRLDRLRRNLSRTFSRSCVVKDGELIGTRRISLSAFLRKTVLGGKKERLNYLHRGNTRMHMDISSTLYVYIYFYVGRGIHSLAAKTFSGWRRFAEGA